MDGGSFTVALTISLQANPETGITLRPVVQVNKDQKEVKCLVSRQVAELGSQLGSVWVYSSSSSAVTSEL